MRGSNKIAKDYLSFFRSTIVRDLKIEVSQINQDDDSSAVVDGIMNTKRRSSFKSKLFLGKSSFRLVLIKINGQYKITSFDW